MSKLIEVKELYVSYGQQEVLSNITFQIEEGDYIGLVGANGSGKTTLVKALLGLVSISSGEIVTFGGNGEIGRAHV